MATQRESALEKKCCDWLKRRGCMVLKAKGYTGVPDRLVLCDDGHAFFIEFKKLGKRLSPAQREWFWLLADRGFMSYLVDSWDEFGSIMRDLNLWKEDI